MKKNYKKMWLFLRKQIKEDLKRAKFMHEEAVKNFKWKGYGRDWDEIDSIISWQEEESHKNCLNEILDEIQGKKWYEVIMTKTEFKKWKEKIEN